MRWHGYVAVTTAAILWAAGATVASALFDAGASPLEVTAARAWIATLGLAAIVRARRRGRALNPPPRSLGAVVPFGVSLAAANFFYYLAISRLPVAVAIVIQYTAPCIVVVWTAASERRAPSRRVAGALALALAGVVLLSELHVMIGRGELRLDPVGVAAAAGSAVGFAGYMLIGQTVGARFGPDAALFRGFAVAGIFWAAVLASRGRPETLLDRSFIPGILLVSVAATLTPFLLFLWGVGRVGAARAGVVSTLEPVAAALFAFLWLGQTLTPVQILGSVIVIAGIGIVQSERPPTAEVLAEVAALE